MWIQLINLRYQMAESKLHRSHLINKQVAINYKKRRKRIQTKIYTRHQDYLFCLFWQSLSNRTRSMATMLATTSSNSVINRYPMMTAFPEANRGIIKSLFSAPFRRVTKNLVTEKASGDPHTDDEDFWRQRFKRRKLKMGKPITFCWFPLPTWAA